MEGRRSQNPELVLPLGTATQATASSSLPSTSNPLPPESQNTFHNPPRQEDDLDSSHFEDFEELPPDLVAHPPPQQPPIPRFQPPPYPNYPNPPPERGPMPHF